MQAWPILINVDRTSPVLLAGVFCGESKPKDINEYLNLFISELSSLISSGFVYKSNHYEVKVRAFICDSPARAFVLGSKSHSAYFGCHKCYQRGKSFQRRIIYQLQESLPRTDAQFRNRTQVEHHNILLPLKIEELPLDIVRQFPFDYMHTVCLGVMKSMLNGWIKIRGQSYSLSKEKIDYLNNLFMSLKTDISKEFARKPRSILDMDRWKAVEFRQFLLYTRPVVLKGVLTESRYEHFMQLSIASFIYASIYRLNQNIFL